MKPIIVIGHTNPDTDAICSAIAYADLKNRTTENYYIAKRAGELNAETKYVLERFGVQTPEYVKSLVPKISDVQYRYVEGIDEQLSLKQVWKLMREKNIKTIPVLSENRHIKGIVTLGDIARFYVEDQDADALAEANTSYYNIVETLNGKLIVGDLNNHFSKGKVFIAAANPEVVENYIGKGDMVILGNRYEAQVCSIQMQAGCIVIGLDSSVPRTIQKLAEEYNCSAIATPLDTFSCAKEINQAVPVRHIMKQDDLITFCEDDLVSDVKKVVSKQRIRYFPIVDHEDKYIGLISQRNLLDMERQKVVLVDHNERDQAVEGIRKAEVIEIIDHHRIHSVETGNPIFFRNEPLGSTATIISFMYQERNIQIPPDIAGLLCSAIISDTLLFQSINCTSIDRNMAEHLAEIAGIHIQDHAEKMLKCRK